jgi:hypothetical protein
MTMFRISCVLALVSAGCGSIPAGTGSGAATSVGDPAGTHDSDGKGGGPGGSGGGGGSCGGGCEPICVVCPDGKKACGDAKAGPDGTCYQTKPDCGPSPKS